MNSPDSSWGAAAEHAELIALLLDLWEDLDAIIAFADGRSRAATLRPAPEWVTQVHSDLPGEPPRDVLARWRSVFADELDLVRRARNNVAHALDLPVETLHSAVYTAAKLIVFARLSASRPDTTEETIGFTDKRLARALSLKDSSQTPPASS